MIFQALSTISRWLIGLCLVAVISGNAWALPPYVQQMDWRVWELKDGRAATLSIFALKGEKAFFLSPSGITREVPIELLSRENQTYLAYCRKLKLINDLASAPFENWENTSGQSAKLKACFTSFGVAVFIDEEGKFSRIRVRHLSPESRNRFLASVQIQRHHFVLQYDRTDMVNQLLEELTRRKDEYIQHGKSVCGISDNKAEGWFDELTKTLKSKDGALQWTVTYMPSKDPQQVKQFFENKLFTELIAPQNLETNDFNMLRENSTVAAIKSNGGNDFATKSDLNELESRLRGEIGGLRSEVATLRNQIATSGFGTSITQMNSWESPIFTGPSVGESTEFHYSQSVDFMNSYDTLDSCCVPCYPEQQCCGFETLPCVDVCQKQPTLECRQGLLSRLRARRKQGYTSCL